MDNQNIKIPIRDDQEIKRLAQELVNKMSLKEKIGQLYESGYIGALVTGAEYDSSNTIDNIRKGLVGSILGLSDQNVMYKLQYEAMSSKNKIPLLFCNDIIHGCRTGFPINLALSNSFDENLLERVGRISAFEASHMGINIIFSPMLDLTRDPRWGRVMEGNGEDPYLSKRLGSAYIRGAQGDLINDSVGCCLKHYVGYGAVEAGREYNTVDFSRRHLFEYYLKPFKAGIDSGAVMVMTSFNTFEDIPVTANKYLLRDVLRDKLGFKGVIISDYTSTLEIIKHGIARNKREVAKKCILAGLDHEMIGTSYIEYLEDLVNNKEIDVSLINEAAARMIELKYRLGLFDNPYKSIYFDSENYMLSAEAKKLSYEAACKSCVLLKNDNDLLPLKSDRVAFIGPMVDSQAVIGAWGGYARGSEAISLKKALDINKHSYLYARGSNIFDTNDELIQEAIEVANKADIVVLALGENQYESGEAKSKVNLELNEAQLRLFNEIARLNKKIVLLISSGRPMVITNIYDKCNSILATWFLGNMSGCAIEALLYGKENPSGKLTMSWPRAVGQIPIYYNHLNTGRPYNPSDSYTSHYLDIENEPLFPFGYGLSYSKISYSDLKISNKLITKNNSAVASIKIKNESNIKATEIVELYIKAHSFSVSRPVLELKGFKRINLMPYEEELVEFEINEEALKYYNIDYENKAEDGSYSIYIGPSSRLTYKIDIEYKDIN